MFYYLYEIKNLVNDKIYVGVHKTKNMDDGYMGSGKVILSAIKKHGPENFTKTILETFENSEDMFRREKEVVTDEFLAHPDTYNLRRGGMGGFDYINSQGLHNKFTSAQTSLGGKRSSKIANDNKTNFLNEANRIKARNTRKSSGNYNKRLIGRVASDETKTKMRNSSSGPNNSQFGSMWITDGVLNQKIHKSEQIPPGWRCGRNLKPRPT